MTSFLTDAAGKRTVLAGTTILGRSVDCGIRLPGRRVAQQHGVITRLSSGGDLLVCLNTSECIQLNHARLLVPTLLQPGDVLHIGTHRLVYSRPETPEHAPAPPAANPAAAATEQLTNTAVIAFSPDGRAILWTSQQASVWIPRYFAPAARTRVPAKITAWLARIAPQTEPDALRCGLPLRQLVLRLVERTAVHCLVVATEEERLNARGIARLLHLTQREGEVLYWLVVGKDRTQVGRALGVSKRTIGKHCEHLFTKLGVKSRAAAVRLVVARRAGN